MWHNAYYSLGFLWNQYDFENSVGHEPSDAFSVKKALSINPYVKLFSDEYENILKYEFFDFIKKHPLFFIKSIFAKIGVILMYIVLFMNIGLILLFYSPLSYQLNIMFLSGIGFNSLFGIISTPEYQYLTGVFAFSVIYSICIMDNAVANGVLNNIKIKKIFTR